MQKATNLGRRALVAALPLFVIAAPHAPAAAQATGEGQRAASDRGTRAQTRVSTCREDPRVSLGLVTLETCVGAELFFRETFDGNGRTCGSCHPAHNNYTLDARFIAGLPATDPLFVADQKPELAGLELPALLREHGLVVVNPDGFEAPTEKLVVRSVSHMLGLATSIEAPLRDPELPTHATDGTLLPPLERLGWGGDGAPGDGALRDFADGAIEQHMTRSLARVRGVDFVLPTDEERDAIAAFSRSIGRTSELDLARVELRDAAAERGRDTFLHGRAQECALRCHVNAGANSFKLDAAGNPIGLANSSFDIGTALVRLPEVDALGIPFDGGFGRRPLDLDGDGELDSFGNGGMNVAPLIEAADTAPMYHSHRFATLEDAIRFYASDDFARSFVASTIDFPNRELGEAMPLTEQDITDLGRFLRVLNTSLNCQMASSRLGAMLQISEHYGKRHREVQRGLVELARAEVDDALEVLAAVSGLHPDAQLALRWAAGWLEHAARARHPRAIMVRAALALVRHASSKLGTGLTMEMGQGTLMF